MFVLSNKMLYLSMWGYGLHLFADVEQVILYIFEHVNFGNNKLPHAVHL
jgi:hypothetical protein